MKIRDAECWHIPEAGGLDSILVFWLDFGPNQGQVTIVCWGQAWTAYFGGMGEKTIREFFARADTEYLVSKMGITPMLKQSKKNGAYLGKIIESVRDRVKAEGRPA